MLLYSTQNCDIARSLATKDGEQEPSSFLRLKTMLLSLKSFHCWYHFESLCNTTPMASLTHKLILKMRSVKVLNYPGHLHVERVEVRQLDFEDVSLLIQEASEGEKLSG